jgi:hypothetical protein
MTTFTLIHVLISLIGIFSGLVFLFGLFNGKEYWTTLFLASTVATSVTGFFFPFHGFTPALGVGIISLVVLAVALFARYSRHLVGGWRKTFVITSAFALYLNVFVLIVQAFQKVPSLHALAPTQSEVPFKLTQAAVLLLFVALTFFAVIRFRERRGLDDGARKINAAA